MSNVFKYPLNQNNSYLTTDDSLLLGALQRANDFLTSDNSATTPYTAPYKGEAGPTDRFAGLSPRTAQNTLTHISKFRTYYGVASGSGLDGYPTYQSIWEQPSIYCYFHIIKFRITNAYPNATTGTLTLECRRDSSSHTGLSFTGTSTHGMGNATTKYTDTYGLSFDLSGFDTAVAGEWGNYLNGNTYGLKVIDALTVEVYTDDTYATPVNIGPSGLNWSAYTSGGFCVSDESNPASFQLLYVTLVDRGNKQMYAYDKDYYSGAGNEVNNDFGANIVGARPSYYVSKLASTSTFYSNPPVDYLSVTDWQYDSAFNPAVTIQCSGDGGVFTGAGANGCVTGVTFDVEFGGLMLQGGTASSPFSDYAECILLPADNESDASAGYDFSISNITQANPAVVTFTNSIYAQTGNPVTFDGIVGMTELNSQLLWARSISHNQIELYEDAALTTGVDSTAYTAYTSGGSMQDYDNNSFGQIDVFSADFTGRDFSGSYANYAPMPLDATNAGSFDQVWPTTVSPAKMDITVIHPTRKTYAQDLTRYTNSTGAYGYRISLTYNNISKSAWRELDGFIKAIRGATAPFKFEYSSGIDGGGYTVFDNDSTTTATWSGSSPRLAKDVALGDTAVYFTGFKPNTTPGTADSKVSTFNDVFTNLQTYRGIFTYNNVAYAGGNFETNAYGEAIIRFTAPVKTAMSALNNSIAPHNYTYFQCMLSDDEVEYDFHPIGETVSFKIDMDVV